MNRCDFSIYEMREKIINKEVKAVEVLEGFLKRIHTVEDQVQAYITLTEEVAFEKAKTVDEKIEKREPIGALAGIPMAVKDNICTEGIKTTCGSKMLHNFIPAYSATVYERLLDADAILLGKTNLDEFAMGSSTETSYYKKTKNPWDLGKVPGGSSGGSAAAVAAGEALFALGSDTGGSIRQPAAFCGVVGLKPTYGLVSRYGLVAMANSLDQMGPITKNVRDCAMVLNTIAGHDDKDGTSCSKKRVDYCQNLDEDIKGLKIALPKEYFDESLSEPVRSALMEAVNLLKDLGAICQVVSLPHTKYAMAAYHILSQSEASLILARFDGIRYGHRSLDCNNVEDLVMHSRTEGFGPEVKRRIMMGTYWLSGGNYEKYYKKAVAVRDLIRMDFHTVFSQYDLILTPTTATTAFGFGLSGEKEKELIQGKLDQYTVSSNLAGIPAISIPCGFYEGLPIGMQLIGRHFDEETILKVARAFEKARGLDYKPRL